MSGSSPVPFQDVSLNPEQLLEYRDDLTITQVENRDIVFTHRLLCKYESAILMTIEDSEKDEGVSPLSQCYECPSVCSLLRFFFLLSVHGVPSCLFPAEVSLFSQCIVCPRVCSLLKFLLPILSVCWCSQVFVPC